MTRWLAVLLTVAAVAGAADPVTITDDGFAYYETDQPGLRYGNRLFRIGGLAQSYALLVQVTQHRAEDGTWKTTRSSVGMPQPTEANWYHSGFFGIAANGQSIQDRDLVVAVEETGALGVISFTWEHPLVTARARFLLEPGSDRLLLEIRWEGKPELNAMRIGFTCYPQGYRPNPASVASGETLERHLITPERDIRQVRTVALNLPAEWWQIYQDALLERAPFYSPSGPCALAILPDDVELAIEAADQATVEVTGYPVNTTVNLALDSGRARFALWDFTGKTTREAEQLMEAQAPAVLERLRHGPWLPASIAAFDAATEKVRLDRLAEALGAPQPGLDGLRRQAAALAVSRQALVSPQAPLAAEQAFRTALAEYRLGVWQAARPTRREPRVLLLEGVFGYPWQVAPIARRQWGADAVRVGGHIWKYWIGHRVSYFPGTVDELLGFDVVVLADFPRDPLTLDKQQMLADFVQRGGGLLILGGPHACGAGNWADSPLEPLFPVQVGGPFDLRQLAAVPAVALTPDGRERLGELPRDLGVATWRHDAGVRPGAVVWAAAGETPFAVTGTTGAGRVVTVLGAPLGEPPAGTVAVWESPAWEPFLTRTLVWLASGR